MRREVIFTGPAWAPFVHIVGLCDLPVAVLIAADFRFEKIHQTGRDAPSPSDYALWAQSLPDRDPTAWLEDLTVAMRVILPGEVEKIAAACDLLPKQKGTNDPATAASDGRRTQWDPCARPEKFRERKVSLNPWQLPEEWQRALRQAAQGLPGERAPAPARDILQRMRDKLCQLAWAARQDGLPEALTEEVTGHYLNVLEARLRRRAHGIRWATMRATSEELYRFARYMGSVPESDMAFLRRRLSRYDLLERGQDARKFYALLETGNTTLGILDKAEALLGSIDEDMSAEQRHRLRHAGAILGLYSVVPLRNADADLVFGRTLLWESETWVIDTEISKTRKWNPEPLVVPLEPEFARFIDVVVRGDHEDWHLSELRAQAIEAERRLFLHPDGSRPSSSYIARIFKKHAGTSFTTTRTMLHTDQAISRGEAGTRDTMAIAHQTSPETAQKYQEKRVRKAAVERVQSAASARRSELISPELRASLEILAQSGNSSDAPF